MAFAFIKHDTKIDFIGKRHIAYAISILLLLVGLGSALWGNGLRMGIDFAGGVIVQVQFAQPVEDEVLKKSLDVPELPGISTQRFGEGTRDYLLRFSSAENTDAAALRTNVLAALAKAFPGNDVEIQRLEIVGPKVGDDLTNKALGALYYATLLIAVYISGRFEQRWMAGVAMAAVLWGGMYLAGLTGLSMGWLVLVADLIGDVVGEVLGRVGTLLFGVGEYPEAFETHLPYKVEQLGEILLRLVRIADQKRRPQRYVRNRRSQLADQPVGIGFGVPAAHQL